MEYLQHLSIAVSLGPDRARIFLCGERDLNTADTLRTRFNETLAGNGTGRRSVIMLDLKRRHLLRRSWTPSTSRCR